MPYLLKADPWRQMHILSAHVVLRQPAPRGYGVINQVHAPHQSNPTVHGVLLAKKLFAHTTCMSVQLYLVISTPVQVLVVCEGLRSGQIQYCFGS